MRRRRAARNPVHCALALVTTIFGVALLFINQGADFLAAVQIIVYAGAIVILFLFVIMLLGVDRPEQQGRALVCRQRRSRLIVLVWRCITGSAEVRPLAGHRAWADERPAGS